MCSYCTEVSGQTAVCGFEERRFDPHVFKSRHVHRLSEVPLKLQMEELKVSLRNTKFLCINVCWGAPAGLEASGCLCADLWPSDAISAGRSEDCFHPRPEPHLQRFQIVRPDRWTQAPHPPDWWTLLAAQQTGRELRLWERERESERERERERERVKSCVCTRGSVRAHKRCTYSELMASWLRKRIVCDVFKETLDTSEPRFLSVFIHALQEFPLNITRLF